jgi:hypothetical protein
MDLAPFAALDHGDDPGGAAFHGDQILQRTVERRVGAPGGRRGGFGPGVLVGTDEGRDGKRSPASKQHGHGHRSQQQKGPSHPYHPSLMGTEERREAPAPRNVK